MLCEIPQSVFAVNASVLFVQMTEQRKRRQRMGFVDVQTGSNNAMVPPSAAGGNIKA